MTIELINPLATAIFDVSVFAQNFVSDVTDRLIFLTNKSSYDWYKYEIDSNLIGLPKSKAD